MHSNLASFLTKRPFPERASSGPGGESDLKRRKQAEITEEDKGSSSYGTEKIRSKSPIKKPKGPKGPVAMLEQRQRSQKEPNSRENLAGKDSVGQTSPEKNRFD